MIDLAVFLLLAAAAATALGAGLFLVCNDWFEHGAARRRAARDYDSPEARPSSSEIGARVRLFLLGLFGSSLLTLPIDLGFAGTFTVILFGSFSFCLAPELLGRAGGHLGESS